MLEPLILVKQTNGNNFGDNVYNFLDMSGH